MDYETEYNDLSSWLSQFHREIYADYKMGRMGPWNGGPVDNINLPYPIIVNLGDNSYYADCGEVFTDEQGVQWLKFVAKNGYHKGKEHMLRTDRVMIVRNDGERAASLING